MALGDGIRRNIKDVDPSERALLRDAFKELNNRFFPGTRTDAVPGGVSLWFKQDEIHQATHVHHGPEFMPWHREIVNRLEQMLRQINLQLSLHYWDWTEDPRSLANANLGGGTTGTLNLFTPDFMGFGGTSLSPIGEPWLSAGYYVPGTPNDRDVTQNPADPPANVRRSVGAGTTSPESLIAYVGEFSVMRLQIEDSHDRAHGFVNMGGVHISFRDPFVFLLHSNVDRLFAFWQLDAAHPERLEPATIYGLESGDSGLNGNVEPWSTGHSVAFGTDHFTRPWYAPENQGEPHNYKHPSIVNPPCYDTNPTRAEIINPGNVVHFNDVPKQETAMRAATFRIYTCVDATLHITAGPTAPYQLLSTDPVVVHHQTGQPYVEGRVWFEFTPAAGTAGTAVPPGTVTIQWVEKGQAFDFTLTANVITPPTVAVALVLDQSGSMNDNAGFTGAKRFQVLKEAALRFVELIRFNSGVGFIRFDEAAHATNDPTYPGFGITKIVNDSNRFAARNAVSGYAVNPAGSTSVGNGVQMAHNLVSEPAIVGAFDKQAIIVFTDGIENTSLFIADVMGNIHEPTYAIGLGSAQQVNTAALTQLTQGTGGYLLLTDLLSSSIDDYFLTTKYFQQILAGVSNASVAST
jgi:hypothetical protein